MTPSQRTSLWRKQNPEKARAIARRHSKLILFNQEKLQHRREIMRRCWAKHREKYILSHKRWLANNPSAQIAQRFLALLRYSVRQNSHSPTLTPLLGCSISSLRLHLQSLWSTGMSWSNYGQSGWVIDPIRPLSSFNLTDRSHLLSAFHFSNLQPLWFKANQSKKTNKSLSSAQKQLDQPCQAA